MNTVTVRRLGLVACALLAIIVANACARDDDTELTSTQAPSTQILPTPPTGLPDILKILMVSTDLSVGDNRVAFGIIRPGKGAVKNAKVELQTFLLTNAGSPDGPRQAVDAVFYEWPGAVGGAYVANVRFDEAGKWGLRVETRAADGTVTQTGARVTVEETSSTPAIGSPGPRSANRTSGDVDDLAALTTDPNPDPDLYGITIAAAIADPRPLLVSFSTPAFCKTATCGPQLEVVKQLKNRHAGEMNFIHVEVYDNPPEIREQGIAVARIAPSVTEWGLPSEPWTFVVDSQGIITAKYEGFVGAEELEPAISNVLP